MSDHPTPDTSPFEFRPRSDTAFFLGMGSLGGFYLFLILSLILSLMIVPRWGKTDSEKFHLMALSLKKAAGHLEAAAAKATKAEQSTKLNKAITETRRLSESQDVKIISEGALVLVNSTLRGLLKESRDLGFNISGDIDAARKDLRDAADWDRPSDYSAVFNDPNIRYSAKLSFVSCTISVFNDVKISSLSIFLSDLNR